MAIIKNTSLSNKIKIDLLQFARCHFEDIVVPNYYIGDFEMDVFKLSKSGYIIEYEIKISRNDFFADFLKTSMRRSYESYSSFDDRRIRERKHDLIKSGSRCSRFYFVTPVGIVTIKDVPDYCGLIQQNEFGGFGIVKNAPLLNRKKVEDTFYRKLAIQLSERDHMNKRKLINAKNNIVNDDTRTN